MMAGDTVKTEQPARDIYGSVIHESGTLYVILDGSSERTPIVSGVSCTEGDRVIVRIIDHRAVVVSNLTSPPTDDTTALIAVDRADVATQAANDALTAAENAETAAGAAQSAASAAQANATQALADAASAASAASSASSAASSAQSSANAAGQAASRAQAAADAAQGDIDDMQEYFWHDALGAHVLSDTDDVSGNRYRQDMTGSGTEYFELASGTETSVASFGGSGARIGKSGAAHSVIDADGQRFYASDGSTQLANIGYGEGTAEVGTDTAPYYTFGTRAANSVIGNYSVAEGVDVTAGYIAHAEGKNTVASALVSHAEGWETTASGAASHAEGWKTQATSSESHAQNYKTIAAKSAQTAIGTLNLEDTSSTTTHPSGLVSYGRYAFIIGNGSDNTSLGDQRSNAFMVDWQGDIYPQATKMNDFVVEQGTSGIWTYRKWNSGLAEVWGIYSGSIAITTSASGYGGYRSAQITAPNWPFKFSSTPTVTMTGGQGFNGCIINNMQGTNDTRAQFYLSCGTSNAATTRYLHIQAMGRWK